jgi:AcrR family transcriptional regulator
VASKRAKPRAPERGRPKDAGSTEAILQSTLALVAERGYHACSLDEVAARAQASKATIYRRWRSKPELLAAAILDALRRANPPAPPSADPRADLVRIMANIMGSFTRTALGRAIRAMVSEVAFEPELSRCLREVEVERRQLLRARVERALAAGYGEADADVELVVDLLLGVPYFQLLVRQRAPAPASAAKLVDSVLPRRTADRNRLRY